MRPKVRATPTTPTRSSRAPSASSRPGSPSATPAASTGTSPTTADRTIRLQAGFKPNASEPPGGFEKEAPLGEDRAFVQVYFGTCLFTPGCSDFGGGECVQEIDAIFEGVSGTLSLWLEDDGVAGRVDDLVFRRLNGQPGPGPMDLELPHAAYADEYWYGW